MTKKEVSNNEIMEALGQFAQNVDKRFDDIDKRFEQIDDRFERIDDRFGQMDGRFEKIEMHLFKIDNRLDNLESDMADVKTKVNKIYDVLDDHMRRIENILQENQVMKYQQDRLERWIFQLADKMDVKLKYE